MPEELFRSDDLLVRQVAGNGAAGHPSCCVVTFDSFTDFRTLDRPGFGQSFFEEQRIDAIHVIPRDNDWYAYPEMAEAMARIHAATRGYDRVLAYGSSMGAYAAIRFGGLVGANVLLALSPQYSIDPAIVPWERRWSACSAAFTDIWEQRLPFPSIPQAYIAYDPRHAIDTTHVETLAAGFVFERLPLPRAGHPVTGFLAHLGLLQRMVPALCRGEFDAPAFLREAWARRRQSPQWLFNVAEATHHWRRGHRLALLREAVRLAPEEAIWLNCLASELRYAGRFDEARPLYRQAVERNPRHPGILAHYSLALRAMGDVTEALAVMEDVYALSGNAEFYRARLEDLRALAARGGCAPRRLGGLTRFLQWTRRSGPGRMQPDPE